MSEKELNEVFAELKNLYEQRRGINVKIKKAEGECRERAVYKGKFVLIRSGNESMGQHPECYSVQPMKPFMIDEFPNLIKELKEIIAKYEGLGE